MSIQLSEMYGTEGLSWGFRMKGEETKMTPWIRKCYLFLSLCNYASNFFLLMQHWFLDSAFVYKQTMNTLLKKAGIEESPDDHKDDNHGGGSGKQVSFLNSK